MAGRHFSAPRKDERSSEQQPKIGLISAEDGGEDGELVIRGGSTAGVGASPLD
eukprot:CAMPEP_0206321266 /NCGR_PEP_ID=MMETSP0106_2-20121207/18781_1 /ASSEMBLY_ACC=CAM_ASM_000206 /TAXON_ID=81532 /ORGANISM="Acanthoeca-like sp., Strain 10tr" /LENGTH=52 /DNA_ID=CAMNT_0053753321 /DNA_START=143 /DNA_END=298 /DNA_ORIENTATION=+